MSTINCEHLEFLRQLLVIPLDSPGNSLESVESRGIPVDVVANPHHLQKLMFIVLLMVIHRSLY